MNTAISFRRILYSLLVFCIPVAVILLMVGAFGLPKDVNAAGTTYYLDKNDVNAADAVDAGTALKPFKTLVYAYSRIANGDTIRVVGPAGSDPVVYNENARIVATKYFTLIGLGVHPSDIMFTFNNNTQMIIPNTAAGPTLIQNVGFHIAGQGVQANGFDATTGIRDFTLDNVYILSDATQYVVNTVAGVTGLVIKNSEIVINTGGFFKDVNSPTYTLDNNRVTVRSGAVQNGIIFQSTTSTNGGTATITNNRIIDEAGMSPIALTYGGHSSVVIEDNYIQASPTSVRDIVSLQDHSAYSVRRNTLTSSSTLIGSGIVIKAPIGTTAIAYIQDNTIDTYTLGTHAIFLSSESGTDHVPDSLSGSYVSGNTLYNGSSHGVVGADLTHQIMIGYNKNVYVYDNVIHGGAYGVVVKGANEIWTAGGIYNNKFLSNTITNVRIKGPQNIEVHNNILVVDDVTGDCMNVSANGTSSSTGTKFYSNRCHVIHGKPLSIQNDGSHTGSEFHDNIYSVGPGAVNFGDFHGVTYSTFALWKAGTGQESGSVLRDLVFDASYNVASDGTPTSTHFSKDFGTTDFSTVIDLSNISNLTLTNATGSIRWTNATDVERVDLNSGVLIGDNFVSVDPANVSLDSPARVTLNVASCSPVPTIYYASSFYTAASDIIAHGSVCSATTATACTNISCVDNVMTFDVPHFDGFAVRQVVAATNDETSSGHGRYVSVLPYIQSISIQSRNPVSSTVRFWFDVLNATQMAFSNTQSFSDSSFIPYASTTEWKLPEGTGERKVYMRFVGSDSGVFVDESVTVPAIISTPITHLEVPPVVAPVPSPLISPTSTSPLLPPVVVICPLVPGKAYKVPNNPAVWYITENCTKRLFKNSTLYFSYFTSWSEVKTVSEATLKKVPTDEVVLVLPGPKAQLKNGSLVKIINSPKVYYIFSAYKYWVESSEVFSALKFSWSKVVDVSKELLDKYPEGKPIQKVNDLPVS